MPEVHILLLGASFTAPLLLFSVLAWTGVERRRALGTLEQQVRRRAIEPRGEPGVPLRFAALTGAPLPRRVRTAASRALHIPN